MAKVPRIETWENIIRKLHPGTLGLLIVKANEGFSVVEVPRRLYADIIMEKHYNGPSRRP